MDFQKAALDNGLRVITVPMPSMESATVQIFVGAGTRHETERTNGVAHFLEHMAFKGTGRYPSAHAISSAADSVGAEINASTDKERTSYYLKASQNHIDLAFDILSDLVQGPILDAREIEKEKGVILSEIAMHEDMPIRKAPATFEELLYSGLPLGWEVAGRRESVAGMAKDDLVAFRKMLYRPQNMVLAVAGRFDKDRVLELAKRWFGGKRWEVRSGKLDVEVGSEKSHISLRIPTPRRETLASYISPLISWNPSGEPQVKLHIKKTEQTHIVVGVRGNRLGHKDRYVEAVLASVLGGGMSSRLFTELREKRGLAYYIRTEVQHYTDSGYLATRAGVGNDKVEEAIKVILDEYHKFSIFNDQLSNGELKKAKEYIKGRLLLGLEDTEQVTEFFGEHELLQGRAVSVEETIRGIQKVTREDVGRLSKEFFRPERLNLALVGPHKSGEKFKKVLKF